jgi:hypothetical protein
LESIASVLGKPPQTAMAAENIAMAITGAINPSCTAARMRRFTVGVVQNVLAWFHNAVSVAIS